MKKIRSGRKSTAARDRATKVSVDRFWKMVGEEASRILAKMESERA